MKWEHPHETVAQPRRGDRGFRCVSLIVAKNAPGNANQRLVNVSYDPTRELYQALNPLFVAAYEKADRQSSRPSCNRMAGRRGQSRRVISGEQPADVVTLGVFRHRALRKRGLIAANWADGCPIVHCRIRQRCFRCATRQSVQIRDWPDLLAPGVEVVTPDPRTSGNGKLAALAAWAATTTRGGSEGAARAYLRSPVPACQCWKRVPAAPQQASRCRISAMST